MGGLFSKPKEHVVDTDETMRLLETQHRWNNPNVSNMFGDTVTTFGPDGQPQITQTPSETMQGLIEQQQDFVGQGAPQLNLQRDSYSDGMMNQFNSRAGQRAGFSPPPMGLDQMSNLGNIPRDMPTRQPQQGMQDLGGGKPPMPMQDNAPDNGVPIGDGSMKPNFMGKLQKFGQHMTGEEDPKQAMIKALMMYGGKR